jgi:hypothetical protein
MCAVHQGYEISLRHRQCSPSVRGENAVVAEIWSAGGFARNTNVSVRPDYLKIDVIARLNGARMLIQVRTTGWPDGNFTTAPKDEHKVEVFVHRVGGEAAIRYAPAAKVTTLAQQWESGIPA